MTALRDTAVKAARLAGDILMSSFGRSGQVTQHRPHDLKLVTDWQSERAIIDTISQRFPDHGLLSEEYGIIPGFSDYYWIVDPLDGSVNYRHRLPHFAVSIACYRKTEMDTPLDEGVGLPILGVVYLPFFQELYEAAADRPALVNKRPLTVGCEERLTEAVVQLSFGSDEATMQRMERINAVLIRRARKVRIYGATAADLVSVASGKCSALVQGSVRLWDFAAAALILKQAGGGFRASRVSRRKWQIVGGAPGIIDELEAILEEIQLPAGTRPAARPLATGTVIKGDDQ
jgi:fructose-1,6-bisphosphatase/inositol monophosphatase family enzyme